jgi:hypothetical protein
MEEVVLVDNELLMEQVVVVVVVLLQPQLFQLHLEQFTELLLEAVVLLETRVQLEEILISIQLEQ